MPVDLSEKVDPGQATKVDPASFLVHPAGRTCLEVKVLYPPGKGKD
jgi:hypothetical protein